MQKGAGERSRVGHVGLYFLILFPGCILKFRARINKTTLHSTILSLLTLQRVVLHDGSLTHHFVVNGSALVHRQLALQVDKIML